MNNQTPSKRNYLIITMLITSLLAGCGAFDAFKKDKDKNKVEYYGSNDERTSLIIPPDLTQTDPNKNIVLPDQQQTQTTQSSAQPSQEPLASQTIMLSRVLREPGNVKLLRDGTQRWLEVKESADDIWPQLIDFWEKDGVKLVTANPQSGVIETDWLINYADLSSGFEKVLRGIFNKLTSSGERDKYRVRIDRGAEIGTTEIYVTHQGLEEIAIGSLNRNATSDYKWVKRPTEPGLEIEIMRLLMLHLGVDIDESNQLTAKAIPQQSDKARLLIEDTDEPVLVIDDGFARAWQRVGLALDREGYTIFGRNRTQGGYVIEFVDPNAGVKEKNYFKRIFSNEKTKPVSYRLQVRLLPQKDKKTVVAIASEEGIHDSSETAIDILSQLYEQLK